MDKSEHIINEAFYHFVWQHKLFNTTQLKTACGMSVELIHPGLLNSNAGPDFFNAKLEIDGVLWAGNVEIHLNSKDWIRHQHDKDAAYDNVILHVIANYEGPIFNSQGREIPSLEITPLTYVFDNFKHLQENNHKIPCAPHLANIDPLFWLNYKDRLTTERLEQRSERIKNILLQNHGDWEDVFFKMLCRSFGFGINADTFELLGQSLSYKIIAKHRDHLVQLEALLLGQAGFLTEESKDDYHSLLKKEYTFLKAKYKLTPIKVHLWKFLRLRPSNFPTIRLAQLAQLLHQHHSLLQEFIKTESNKLHQLFSVKVSNYWLCHYQFGKLSNERQKTLGRSAINIILINAAVPVLFSYGKHSGRENLCEKSLEILNTLPAEKNHIISLWDDNGLKSNNAFDSQAILQLYKNYCQKRKCMHCNIGHHYVSLQH